MRAGLYSANRFRAYPFLFGDAGRTMGGASPVAVEELQDGVVLDAGFTLIGTAAADSPTLWLDEVVLVAGSPGTAIFTFMTDAEGLTATPLVFALPLTDDVQRVAAWSDDAASEPASEPACYVPVWGGWLVVSDLLTQFGGSSRTLSRTNGGRVEPATVHQISGGIVTGLSVGNVDRTRSSPPTGCDDYVWSFDTGLIYVVDRCLVGTIRVADGYNVVAAQIADRLVFSAVVGAGLGTPCAPVPLFAGETPPEGSTLFEGGVRCNETIRRINGVSGPNLVIETGPGFVLVPNQAGNEILIDVNLAQLTRCDPSSEPASQPASEPA
jgi:hypothetical protein